MNQFPPLLSHASTSSAGYVSLPTSNRYQILSVHTNYLTLTPLASPLLRLVLPVSWFTTSCCKGPRLFSHIWRRPRSLKVSARPRVCMQRFVAERLRNDKDDQLPNSELEEDVSEQESDYPTVEYIASVSSSNAQLEGAGGKPGVLSFYNSPYRREEKILVSTAAKNQNILLWFVGPAVLVASFIFPSLYLRRILSTIFEDSLLTDFLILFFTEALFYCGAAAFLLLIDRSRRPLELVSSDSKLTPPLGYRISSISVLALSLIIPMVTMGFVWPWTGPAASATLAPYLVGIVVQFAFEQYARYIDSPSWSVIPIVFQVYRLHQLNRAAQLVTALSMTVRGAEMTAQNLAINGSLSTLLNVLQFLGVICIWSLSSFIMRFFPSATMAEG
ncbi:uncharacterized protein LOC129900768 isoform X2 [Solanum dulcamara]|uniref:uncharacterized protein LOC129900768 isoform X2 n=1 Tax=Solanum dulcamara TaxID=45834 RepID=UPI0024851758|nr:uncharacterized protein LOC129900768 isoform X2 [Solanum dulcamara]